MSPRVQPRLRCSLAAVPLGFKEGQGDMKGNAMKGKTVLVTGATAGIGRETAKELARQGAKVVLLARNPERAAAAMEWIGKETGNKELAFIQADFSELAQVRDGAQKFIRDHGVLDVLVNNAGAIFFNRQESVDGIEKTFAVNHLAPFLLTNLLLDTLTKRPGARIVTVSSRAHVGAKMDFDDLELKRGYGAMKAYGRSKLANLLFTFELARRLEGSGVTANALHPGFVASQFGKNNGLFAKALLPLAMLFGRAVSVEEGAKTSIYLASSPEVEGVTGKYFVQSKEASSSEASLDRGAMTRLWEISARMTGLPVSV